MSTSFEINEVVNNQKIHEVMGCSTQGGMRRSKRTNTLTLISDKTKLYKDRMVDGIYYYTGMGQVGDQKLISQNRTLAESGSNGVAVHLFEVLRPKEYTYRGQVELAAEPFQEEQKDSDEHLRKVWIFPLRPLDNNSEIEKIENEKRELQDELGDIEKIGYLPIRETEKELMIKTIVGQGKFKKLLLDRQCKCAMCAISDKRLLIAGHIKPWRYSTNEERLDVNNGLLLCPNHDALFDKAIITFDPNGKVIISDTLKEIDRMFLNVNENTGIELAKEQLVYMIEHNERLK